MKTDNGQYIAIASPPNKQITRTVLSNGIVVLVTENPVADIVAARIFVKAGSCCEAAHQSGLVHLLASVLTKGTQQLSSLEIAEQVESVGASLGTDAAADYFLLSLKTVSSDFLEVLALAAALLRSPSFPELEVELERRWLMQNIRSQQEQPFTIAFDQLRQAMYQNHPYASSALGTEATVANLRRDDLIEYHQTYFRPDNLVISITGRIAATEAVAAIEKVFGDWQNPATPLPVLQLPDIESQPYQINKTQPTQQSIVMLGYLAPSVQQSDYVALKLLSTYLGNGLSSRLFVELREKRGLAYDVSAFYPTRQGIAPFVVYIGTAPENTAIALAGLKTEVELLCTQPLEEYALQTAKNKVLGQYALGKQTNAQIAQAYGWYEALGLGIEFDTRFQQQIAAVTAKQLQQAACRYFLAPYISIVGPEDAFSISQG
ncbi:M16 family metallopeptidase [Chroogloeocystis siderophila]|jgi:zinc protease|uniref:Peptidase M16 n=1 Tax=Chroogloeocystis siderophila 5.2 s.c.1 TaxID=247279 RepID=A0A1U7HIE4_9CHRO|nr:pitrilysin family protein [Chroogloeocystis siderophila]OKH23362.1 peptidase M16 [Chroogloeocystis siderophila 5.2 s.c.1]